MMIVAYRPLVTLLPERQAWIGLTPSPLLSARHHCTCQSSKRRLLYSYRAAVQPPGEAEGEEPEQIDIDALARQVLPPVLSLACSLLLFVALVHTRVSAFFLPKYCFPVGASSTLYLLLFFNAQRSLEVWCKFNSMLTSFVCMLQLSQEAERLRRSQAEASSSIDAENLLGAAAEAVRSVSDDIVARRTSSTEAGSSGYGVC